MGQYSAVHALTAVAAKPGLVIASDGNILPEVNRIECGFDATPDDKAFSFQLLENSDMGSGGTAITAKPIGPGATSSATVKGGTFTSDPTTTGVAMIRINVYQRVSAFRACAFGEGWKPTALGANKGLGVWCLTAGAATSYNVCMNWWE